MQGLNYKEHKVLYVDDAEEDRQAFSRECNGLFSILCADSIHQAARVLERERVCVLICDNRMPAEHGMPVDDLCGLFFLKKVRSDHPSMLRALVTGVPEEKRLIPFALINQAGVEKWIDTLERPAWDELVRELLEKHILENVVRCRFHEETTGYPWFPGVVGESPVMTDLLRRIEQICDAGLRSPILLVGESGSGKEVVAKAIHNRGPRSRGPFHVLAKVETLGDTARDTLFGHAKGAFYGAHGDSPGAFEMAHGGTLVIDDVQNLSLDVQADLLRVLESGRFRRLGAGEKEREVDLQLTCTMNEDPERLVAKGKMRKDFFHRINSVTLRVPPLRECKESIPALTRRFIADFNRESMLRLGEGRERVIRGIEPDAFRILLTYDWIQNNVRELKNTLLSAWVSASRDVLGVEDLPLKRNVFHLVDTGPPAREGGDAPWKLFDAYMKRLVDQGQIRLILWANILAGGKTREAADLLGISDNPDSGRVRLHQVLSKHNLKDYIDMKSKEILYECQLGSDGDPDRAAEILSQRLVELFPLAPQPGMDGKRFRQTIREFKLS